MRRLKAIVIACFLVSVVAGCGPSFTEAMKKGEDIPAGKVVIVGKVLLDPPFETVGKKKIDDEPLNMLLGLTFELNDKINQGEGIDPDINETFFFPLPPGKRYIRVGQVMKVVGHNVAGGRPIYEVLRMNKNIKLDIPRKAKIVYIGTIVYHHDGTRMMSVSVRDEYDNAVREAGKMKLPGVKSGDIVKKLAFVVK